MGNPAREKTFYVSGVCCATEEAIIRKRMKSLAGENGYRFNPVTCQLAVNADVSADGIIRELRDAGFGVRRAQDVHTDQSFLRRHALALSTAAAMMLGATGILLEQSGGHEAPARAFLLAAILIGGWRIFRKAWGAVKSRSLDMNVLMSIAVVGALVIDRWGEGAAVIVLFSLSLMLESYSVSRSRRAITSLMTLSPSRASVVRGGAEVEVDAAQVAIGETLIVRPGERIPLDGVIVEGSSSVDQSPITGESVPVKKSPGETVYAGSINDRGALLVRVTKRYEETAIARIVHLVEEAQHQRAPVQSLVDRFARMYTPAVLGIALLVMVVPPLLLNAPFSEWLYRALVLIVIACPCALVISTPITVVSALTNAARQGILIKGGKYIESLAAVTTVAFDKTGTLTEGRPRVTDIVLLNSLSREDVLGVVAAIERRSEHHVASALVAEAVRNAVAFDRISVEHFEALPGRGVTGMIAGTTYYLGNHELCHEQGYCSPAVEETIQRFANDGKTAIILGTNREALAVLGITDGVRHHSKQALHDLRSIGIRHIAMLTGDHAQVAQRVAGGLRIEHLHAGLLPDQKSRVIEDLKQTLGPIAMVGDGINDAPALAASSVGIAMGVNGSDVALETADIVLMSDDVGKLPFLFGLSRRTMSIIKQNIAIAIGLKLIFLVLSISGVATLWMAVLADDGAALLVIFNGIRVLTYGKAP